MDIRRPISVETVPHAVGFASEVDSPGTEDDPCREIDELLDEFSRMAAADSKVEQDHERLLTTAIRIAGARAGAIWLRGKILIEQVSPRAEHLSLPMAALLDARSAVVGRAVECGGSCTEHVDGRESNGEPNGLVCVAATFSIDMLASGAVELLIPSTANHAEQQKALELAVAIAEVVGDFHRRQRLDQYRQSDGAWRAALQFVERIHRANLHETAVAIANEGRWFIGCDRASLLSNDHRGCKLLAVSGVDQIEPRAAITRRISELASVVTKTNDAVWTVGGNEERAPQIEQPLQAFLDESNARALVALPLPGGLSTRGTTGDAGDPEHPDAKPVGVLVLEWFAMPQIDELARQRIELATRHSASALAVARINEQLPLIRISRSLAKIKWLAAARQLPATLWVLGILAAIVIALVIIPADFEVAAEGQLLPVQRREIFSPVDGVVDAVLVEHGDDVLAGQPLLRLRSPALDFEKARLEGEIQTAQKRLAAIQAARYEQDADQHGSSHRHLQLTAEEEELKQELHSLSQQEQLLAAQREELLIRAPIAGRVLTWDVAGSLNARPVERGQSLLSIGDIAGHWELELEVPEHKMGYILSARQRHDQDMPLPVSFLLVTEPGVIYQGEVQQIALRSQVDEFRGEAVVRVTVRFDQPVDDPRPAAGVVGRIHCGRRSLGYVWLHDAWNSIQRRVLF
jgi:multidrug efflux pump subunit AcrA (membrane-fusion protein)